MGSRHMTVPVYGRAAVAVLLGRVHGRGAGQAEGPQAIHRQATSLLSQQVAESLRDRQRQQRHHMPCARPHPLFPFQRLMDSGCAPRRRCNSAHDKRWRTRKASRANLLLEKRAFYCVEVGVGVALSPGTAKRSSIRRRCSSSAACASSIFRSISAR